MATFLRPPSSLPLFLVDGHGFRDEDLYATRPRGTGHHRKRRVATGGARLYSVSWRLTAEQAADLDAWGERTLVTWTRRFIAQVQTEEGTRFWEAAWIEEPSWNPQPTPRGIMWTFEGTIVTFGDWTEEAPSTGEIAAENVLALEGQAVIFGAFALAAENTLALELATSLRAENTLAMESFIPFFLLIDDAFFLSIDDSGNRLRI